ncbi:MAG: acyl-[acyl-carrier-protein] thioesterase [Clostridiales bacterium]|nr:acyl-[acyl-carrier-protein] thioesterase [Clostridiales bacterium]
MYSFQSRVRYSEVDKRGILTLSSLIDYFQDCSTFQSEDLNIGLSYLNEMNRAWILNGWQVLIKRLPSLGEKLEIGTWPYGFKGIYGYRNFIIQTDKSEILAVANSIWVFMNTESMYPTRIPADNLGYQLEPPYPMDYADRKVPIPDHLISYPSFPVLRSNIDSYNHVNNGQYIKMAEEFLPEDFYVSQMRVEYRTSALLGDIIKPMVFQSKDKITVVLADTKDKPYAIVEFI